jgi:diguanylate cyclase (GGDEF)-like protein
VQGGFSLRKNPLCLLLSVCINWRTAIAVCALALSCAAQHLSLSSITSGLDNLNVNCIAQDRSGYLWVGTENGLYRYDGSRFRKFGAPDGLRARTIQNLFVAPDGTLFVGTTAGLYFERHDGSMAEIRPPAPVDEFYQRIGSGFTADASGQVVMADRSGAYRLRRTGPDAWTAEPMYLENGAVWSVLYGPDGALWYGCGSDLCRFDGGKTAHLGSMLGLPEDNWLHLEFALDGRLWIRGSKHLGEVFPAEGRYEEHDVPGAANAAPYNALLKDARGRVTASQGSAFGWWEDGAWHMVTERNGLTPYDISAMFVDRDHTTWIGVLGHGLMRWVGQGKWEAYTRADGLSDDVVWASLRDKSGRLWIGTESGLDWNSAGSNTAQTWQSKGISTVRAVSLAESGDGSVWMGSAAGSLVRINEKTLAGRQWKVPEVYRILSDKGHQLWVATAVGLYSVDTGAGDQPPALVNDHAFERLTQRFTDLCLDDSGRLWAASEGGLYRKDTAGWKRINPGLPGVVPYLVAAGKDGTVWASGAFPGIVRLRVENDRVVESQHIGRPRLLSDQAVALVVDRRGWLWVGQDAGLTLFDGQSWRSFTQNDGLIWNDTDAYALAEDPDGSMWIGTSGGLSHLVRPEAMPTYVLRPPSISQLFFGPQPVSNRARIPWSAEPLTVSLAALNFSDAYRIYFRYRLLGLESEWVETNEETVRYPRLDPGSYRFQAETVDANDGVVSSIAEIDFRIVPHWWQSDWLLLAVVLLAVVAVVQVWRWRIQRLVGQKQHLELAVQRRTEDLEREKAELLRAREQMRHFAEHDDLTGLWNHRIIMERLRIEVQRSRREKIPLSVILVDLDHFKQINDTLGHPAGDLALKEMGTILLRSVRSYDWVGRYGGEEFLLILPGSSFSSARLRAEQLRMAVQSARIADGERPIQMTASFGVASGFPTDYEALIKAADSALYQAKNSGRNCVIAAEV